MTRPVRRAGRASLAALALALTAAALVTGCSGGSEEPATTTAPSSSAANTDRPHPVESQVSFGEITGRLTPKTRQRLSAQVGEVVDGWADAAYLGGDYPRRDFSDAWPGFTAGAKQEAHGDRALMSNEDIGDRIDGVTPHRSLVHIDVLAVKTHPVGVTAHVFLGFGTTGDLEREVRVKGRLFLTHTDRGWKVFGYDMTKGAV
jgi:hypothetical protein